MNHITTQYGEDCNLLELSVDDYYKLERFLLKLGVRSRMISMYQGNCLIQAENVYPIDMSADERKHIECVYLNEKAIRGYKI